MASEENKLSSQEKQTLNEMLFTLSERDRGTLAMAVTPNEWKRKDIYRFLQDHLKEYAFFELDLTSYTYISLHRALLELLPANILHSEPVRYFVSITGLDSSLRTSEDGKIEFSSLVAQLNFEREFLFNQPYIIFLWVSDGFDMELRKRAPDLMHWMSKRFVFEEGDAGGFEVAESAIEYGEVKKRGKIPQRLERIRQLEETWEKLKLHDEDQARLVKDKISLLLLLGKEYAAAFEFQKAESAFEKALSLNNKIKAGREGELFFEFGSFYYVFNRYDQALQYFQKALEAAEKYGNPHVGNVYHMLGIVYQKQRKWMEASENYQKALEWYKKMGVEYSLGAIYHQLGRLSEEQLKWGEALANYGQSLEWKTRIGNEYELGNTYHQIGMVYQGQERWKEALENYHRALEWNIKTGNEYELGGTHHQIGRAYQEQGKWEEALENYHRALEWKTKTGNEYELGRTYHQIGRVYEEQGKWEEALKGYHQALEWKTKTGNEYQLGATYFHIGRVFESKNELVQGLDWFEKALQNHERYDHPNVQMDHNAIARVQKKVSDQETPNPPSPNL